MSQRGYALKKRRHEFFIPFGIPCASVSINFKALMIASHHYLIMTLSFFEFFPPPPEISQNILLRV